MLKIGKCLLQYALELQKDYKNNKLRFRNLSPAFPSFSKKRKRGYVTSFYGSKFAVFQKKKIDLGYYKMKEIEEFDSF